MSLVGSGRDKCSGWRGSGPKYGRQNTGSGASAVPFDAQAPKARKVGAQEFVAYALFIGYYKSLLCMAATI
jgi:hypothetical protein